MNVKLNLIALAVRTSMPRPRQRTPLEEAAAEAARQLVQFRMRVTAAPSRGQA